MSQVRHQIQLLKNVFWWYLLPIAVPIVIFFVHAGWLVHDWWGLADKLLFAWLVNWGIYELNQQAVRKNLIPQAEALQTFINSLEPSPNESEDNIETT